MRTHSFVVATALAGSTLVGCVSSGTHEEVLAQLNKTQEELASTQAKLAETEDARAKVTTEKEEVEQRADALNSKLTDASTENQILAKKVTEMGANVETLVGEKTELRKEVEELDRMRAAAEARNKEYNKVFQKLQKMVDAGTLSIKFRGGRMLVQMSSDVVFPPGGTRIKPEAEEAIRQLAETISSFPDRKFQVIGHSDATPIKTARFPSNWELSSQRAIEVVKVLVGAGVAPGMISAAGAAEYDPLVPNETTEQKAMNRRVEIVFLPKLDELPGNIVDGDAKMN
ncbi:MAG: flagellar motor protein MotB [Myxococcota bacterium]